jgi:hypothetical protein
MKNYTVIRAATLGVFEVPLEAMQYVDSPLKPHMNTQPPSSESNNKSSNGRQWSNWPKELLDPADGLSTEYYSPRDNALLFTWNVSSSDDIHLKGKIL